MKRRRKKKRMKKKIKIFYIRTSYLCEMRFKEFEII